jgi:Transposase DDE domain group 1
VLLIPFVAKEAGKAVDHLSVVDLSAELIRLFLADLETSRRCAIVSRNQRLAAIHALARFVGEHSPEHIAWCAQLRTIPFKKPTASHLRRDPVHGLICGKNDPLGQDRILAGHSTLNRLELSAQAIDARYCKIQVQPDGVQELLIERGVKAIPRKSAEIVLDFDATDNPLHGSQEGAYFHDYYGDYC